MEQNTHSIEVRPQLEVLSFASGVGEVRPQRRRSSAWLFGTALQCFFLPFVTITCPYPPTTVTGIQAATGFSPPGSHRAALDNLRGDTAVPNPLATIALCSAIAGLGFGFVKGRRWLWASLAAGAIGTIALVGFVIFAFNETMGSLRLRPGLLAVPLFISASGLNAFRLRSMKKPPLISSDPRALASSVKRASSRARRVVWALGAFALLRVVL